MRLTPHVNRESVTKSYALGFPRRISTATRRFLRHALFYQAIQCTRLLRGTSCVSYPLRAAHPLGRFGSVPYYVVPLSRRLSTSTWLSVRKLVSVGSHQSRLVIAWVRIPLSKFVCGLNPREGKTLDSGEDPRREDLLERGEDPRGDEGKTLKTRGEDPHGFGGDPTRGRPS